LRGNLKLSAKKSFQTKFSAVDLIKFAAKILTVAPRRTFLEWADKNRWLPTGTTSEPGWWRSSRVPYLKPIAEAFNDPKYTRIVLMCGSQMAKTEMCLNAIGYIFDDRPTPVIFVTPTQRQVENISSNRITPMILNCESLKDKLFVDKVGEKIIQGARLKFAWSSSPNELASDPAEIVFLDEVDRMKILKEEGDPVEIAVGRTASFPDGKLVITSRS
jgi:phage terminase large subunit GpA-like protein